MSELGLIEPGPVTWTDARVEELKRLHGEEFSAAQIAGILGHVTRNAVLGKINRLGLSLPNAERWINHPPKIKMERPKRSSNNYSKRHCLENQNRVRRPISENSKRVLKIVMNGTGPHLLETTISKEAIKLRCAEIEPLNLTLMELEADECRYPVNDASPYLFCGHAREEGSSYCYAHKVLCWSAGTYSERRAAETVSA